MDKNRHWHTTEEMVQYLVNKYGQMDDQAIYTMTTSERDTIFQHKENV